LLALGAGVAGGALFAGSAAAVLKLDVTQGNVQPLPIALPDFVGGALPDPGMAHGVTQIIASNLQRSGLFAPIDQRAYIERISNIDQVRFPDWRQINAQALVTGRLARLAPNISTARNTRHHLTTGGASRISSRTRSTNASPARRATSTRGSSSSTSRGRKNGG
jgi:hypothetical protein